MEDQLTPKEIQRLRSAAESAWGDDTRPEKYQGHPLPALGQCLVTSQWLQHRLGGYVGLKNGHFFHLSPDKEYGLDLAGDHAVFPPGNPDYEGIQQGEDDPVGYRLPTFHRSWHAAPPVYKRSNHHLFSNARVVNYQPGQRAQTFIQRANEAYDNS